ncbi:MAG: hypothetical protein IJG34_11320 [Synergistaceae bacterium]|nr:hypothetical protein [Synergistaceae bacterium]MBQ3450471.1 hypothetical protein [Synergistaceae bacterium]MBQ3693777.1 hypothetical protein [Synergistaceae bacterium]MBQ6111387.1 hypothetical protein [Synergistaceae bacterium]MBQ9628367.1 hypothetical protein [Synergistaceae bacterium]
MEERIKESDITVNDSLNRLTFTVECEQEDGVYCMQAKEFPYAIESSTDYEECRNKLVHSLKEWAMNLTADIKNWKTGHEKEIPYLMKILLSEESEIRECLRYAK